MERMTERRESRRCRTLNTRHAGDYPWRSSPASRLPKLSNMSDRSELGMRLF